MHISTNAVSRFHLDDDLTPYIWTCENCPTGPHRYSRRSQWQEHEETVHYRTWPCPFECEGTFATAVDFVEHVKARHDTNDDPEVLKALVDSYARPIERTANLRCPLCDCRISTKDRWYSHVGAHLRYLSYFSLPAHLVRIKSREEQEVRWPIEEAPTIEPETVPRPTSKDGRVEGQVVESGPRHATVESNDSEENLDMDSASEIWDVERRLENLVVDENAKLDEHVHTVEKARRQSVESVELVEVVERELPLDPFADVLPFDERSGAVRDYSGESADRHDQIEPRRHWTVEVGDYIESGGTVKGKSSRKSYRRVAESDRKMKENVVGQGDEPEFRSYRRLYMDGREERLRDEEIVITRDKWGREREIRIRRQFRPDNNMQEGKGKYDNLGGETREVKPAFETERRQFEESYEIEMEEMRLRRERERREIEEVQRIRRDIEQKEADGKSKQERDEMALRETMSKRLADAGFTEAQIRSIVDRGENEKPRGNMNPKDNIPEDEREYYNRNCDHHMRGQRRNDIDDELADLLLETRRGRGRPQAGGQARDQYGATPYFDPDDYAEPIRFEDAEYRRNKIPFKTARTWKGMQKTIREMYHGAEAREMDEDVMAGKYQIADADDNIILPTSWEAAVKPGYVYKMAVPRPSDPRQDDENPFRGHDVMGAYDDFGPRRTRSPIPLREREPSREERKVFRERSPARDWTWVRRNENARDKEPTKEMEMVPESTINFRSTPTRDSHRKGGTKAVSWDPYIDDDAGWYPDLERATGGGFRRPARQPTYAEPRQHHQHDTSSAYNRWPSPPPRPFLPPTSNDNPSARRPRPAFPKINRKYLSTETLKYYHLPCEIDRVGLPNELRS